MFAAEGGSNTDANKSEGGQGKMDREVPGVMRDKKMPIKVKVRSTTP